MEWIRMKLAYLRGWLEEHRMIRSARRTRKTPPTR
jgi:hypothetical protein